jgi:hypothetical protein
LASQTVFSAFACSDSPQLAKTSALSTHVRHTGPIRGPIRLEGVFTRNLIVVAR